MNYKLTITLAILLGLYGCQQETDQADSGQISDGVFVGLTAFAILAIGGFFIFLTPAKIKKLE